MGTNTIENTNNPAAAANAMNFDLTAEEIEFADGFRKFCLKEIAPFTAQADESGHLPASHYKKLAEIGYTGLLHNRKYGGQEATYAQAVLAQMILSEYCASTFFSVGASCGLFGGPIADYGTEEQKKKYLPALIKGETVGALAITEPGAGSDVSRLIMTAQEMETGYTLNGQKTYITNAPICDFALVLARLKDAKGADAGLTHFIVDMKIKGISRGKPMKKMGLRASPTGEIFFEDAKIPHDAILGRPGHGFRITMQAFNKERLALAAYSVGVMQACLEDSRRYAKERKAFGKIIAKQQSVAFMLADILTKLEASKLLLMETAFLMDESEKEHVKSGKFMHNGYTVDITARCAEIKLMASTYAREVTNLAVQIHGGAGYMEEFRVARMYRDIKIAEIGGGTSEIQKQIVARAESKRIPK